MSKTNALVFDGGEVKFRLEAERQASSNLIHIDWLRFTVFLRNVVPTLDSLPAFDAWGGKSKWDRYLDSVQIGSEAFEFLSAPAQSRVIRSTVEDFEKEHRDPQFIGASSQAFELAGEVAAILGPDFTLNNCLKPGQDFYKYRISIERNGHECAWVGFLAAGNGKSKGSQDQSIHVNIQGHACTFAQHGWREKMAHCIELHRGRITRVDLALDLFEGLGYDFGRVLTDYKSGLFNVRGKRPACSTAGDWGNDSGRSLYVGSRTSGKVTNIYEKGDALFGVKALSPWVRAELRYGDQLRVLPADILRNPDTYFSGASDWHESLLTSAGCSAASVSLKTTPALPEQTIAAEVHRNLTWLRDSAASTLRAALKFIDFDTLVQLVNPDSAALPGRLTKFKTCELSAAYNSVLSSFTTVGGSTASLRFAA